MERHSRIPDRGTAKPGPYANLPINVRFDPLRTFARSGNRVAERMGIMVELSIALAVVVILGAASVWADNRFRREERLPMQWSFARKVNWTAPRRIALAFTPVLAAVVLGAVAVAVILSGDARAGQEGMGPSVVLLVGGVFLLAHALHLRLIDRSIDKAPE